MSLVSERMRCDLQEGLPAISSMRKRLEIALDVAKALQHLHAEDLIHRDVKLQNVLVSERLYCLGWETSLSGDLRRVATM